MIPRAAKPTDETAVSDLLAACYPALMATAYSAEELVAALPIMIRAQPALLASGRFAVIDRDRRPGDSGAIEPSQRIVACGGYSLDRPGSGGSVEPGLGHIRHFATDPAATRSGLGRRIYDWCSESARRDGCRALECYAALNAVPFYRAMGFELIGRDKVIMGGGTAFAVAVMRAQI